MKLAEIFFSYCLTESKFAKKIFKYKETSGSRQELDNINESAEQLFKLLIYFIRKDNILAVNSNAKEYYRCFGLRVFKIKLSFNENLPKNFDSDRTNLAEIDASNLVDKSLFSMGSYVRELCKNLFENASTIKSAKENGYLGNLPLIVLNKIILMSAVEPTANELGGKILNKYLIDIIEKSEENWLVAPFFARIEKRLARTLNQKY